MIEVNSYLARLKKDVKEISVDECLSKHNRGGLLIDIREKDEVSSGSPTGAIRISKGVLEMNIDKIATDESVEILLLCASGRRSLVAANCLQQMGFTNVYSVAGGFNQWKQKSLPFETPSFLRDEDLERYKRHVLIPEVGEEGQRKLLQSKVLIVGAGGIGSPVALYLAAAGVGEIAIVDDDVVDRTNLQRQILHSEKTVGALKVLSAKERLESLNPSIKIIPIAERLEATNVERIISGYNVVIDGTDNFNTRYLINDACVKLKIPNVHGSVYQFEGQVSTFWPSANGHEGPCYRCVYPSPPPPELAPSCAEAGVLGVLPGMVGVMCSAEAIKILLKIGELMIGRILCFNALTWQFDTYNIVKDAECPYCNCTDAQHYPQYSDYAAVCSA